MNPESILEEMEKFCTLSQKEHQSNSIPDLFNKLRHNIYRIACESDFKLSEVKEAQETDEVLLRISMETEDKTKINLETEETKERDKGSPRVSMEKEEKLFHDYRRKWEKSWSSKFGRCGRFEDTTLLSPMHFTYCAPGRNPYAASTGRTLQFYSIKVAEIKKALGLTWPLDVYGVVAARDNVDRNRNIIFLRGRDDCQTLTQKDPFLRLIGPSRAIVTRDPIHLEIELKAKGRTKSEDRVLMTDTWYYRDNYCGLCTLYTPLVTNLCTIVLSSEELEESVQATIVGVRIVEGSLPAKKKDSSPPFKYGGRVVCSSTPLNGILPDSQHITEPSFRQVVLQDGAMSVCKDGYVDLARHVVSVELDRRLKVIVYAYSRSGDIAPRGHIFFDAQKSNVSHGLCYIDDYEVEISVAWSCLVREKLSILMEGRV